MLTIIFGNIECSSFIIIKKLGCKETIQLEILPLNNFEESILNC